MNFTIVRASERRRAAAEAAAKEEVNHLTAMKRRRRREKGNSYLSYRFSPAKDRESERERAAFHLSLSLSYHKASLQI
jgi:hypothetical protein